MPDKQVNLTDGRRLARNVAWDLLGTGAPLLVAFEGLMLWLGSEFADNSTLVLQLLAVGVFINSLAHVPSGLEQGAGRPDLTAKLI